MAKEGTGMQGLAHIVGGRDSIDPPSHRTWKWPKSGRYGGRRGRAAETPSSKTAIARGPLQSLQRESPRSAAFAASVFLRTTDASVDSKTHSVRKKRRSVVFEFNSF